MKNPSNLAVSSNHFYYLAGRKAQTILKAFIIVASIFFLLYISSLAFGYSFGNKNQNLTYNIVDIAGVRYQSECLIDCDLPIEVVYDGNSAPDTYLVDSIPLSKLGARNLSSAAVYWLNFSNITIQDYDTWACFPYDYTNETGSYHEDNCSYVWSGSHNKTVYNWINFNDAPLLAVKGAKTYINVHTKYPAQLGKSGADIIPGIKIGAIAKNMTELAWHNSSWANRTEINVTGGNITLTNFPILVNVSFQAGMQQQFQDLRFVEGQCTGAQNVSLYHEFDNISDGKYALVYIKIPTLNAGAYSTSICMYFNNSNAPNGENSVLVWDNNYTGVWHLSEGTGRIAKDSTGHSNGSLGGTVTPVWNSTTCLVGNCLQFSNGYVTMSNDGIYNNSIGTLEVWARWQHPVSPTGADAACKPYSTQSSWNAPYTGYCVSANDAGVYYSINTGGVYTSTNIPIVDGYFGIVATTSAHYGFHNGTHKTTGGASTIRHGGYANFSLGTDSVYVADQAMMGGNVDEVRISNVNRSDTWMNLSYQYLKYFNTLSVFGNIEGLTLDEVYPFFMNYYDNNATLVTSGLAVFNVTIENTNGTASIQINDVNYTAGNTSLNNFNYSITLSSGTYYYYWMSWGNGTDNKYNVSEIRYFTVNETPVDNSPYFYNYYDNNATQVLSGIAIFNVTTLNTNGTAFLQINGTNYTATNISYFNQTWINFDGVNDYATIYDRDFYSPSYNNNLTTIFVKFRRNSGDDTGLGSNKRQVIFNKGSTANYEYTLFQTDSTDKQIYAQLFNATGTASTTTTLKSAGTANLDTWYEVALVINGTTIIGYNGGKYVDSDILLYTTNSLSNITLGYSSASSELNGSIADFRIYSSVLGRRSLQAVSDEVDRVTDTRIPIVMYHTLCTGESFCVNSSQFSDHMAFLNASGFHTITAYEMYQASTGNFTLPSNPIVLTFDDGLNNTLAMADIMLPYGFRGVAGVTTNYSGSTLTYVDNTYMTWAQLQNLVNNYHWDIASHSDIHCYMGAPSGTIGACNTTAPMDGNLSYSKTQIINNLGITPTMFIHPYNSWTNESMAECAKYYGICTANSAEWNILDYPTIKSNLTSGEMMRLNIRNTTIMREYNEALNASYGLEGLVGKWTFDEGTGGLANDSSSNKNNANLTGATWNNDNITIVAYNVSLNLTNGTYSYYWGAWGNDKYGISATRYYTILSQSCITPYDGFKVNSTMSFCPGTYYFNGSSNGAIRPNGNNIVIDCNGSSFYGNYSDNKANSVPLFSKPGGNNNVTFKNCNINNYYTGIAFKSSETSGAVINCTFNFTYQSIDVTTGRNLLLTNNTFLQSDYYGIYLESNSNLWHNITIEANYFAVKVNRQIRAEGNALNIAKGVYINRNTVNNGTIYVTSVDRVNITGNIVNSNTTTPTTLLGSNGMYLSNIYNVSVADNQVSGYDAGISFLTDKRQLTATGWLCANVSRPVTIRNNTVFNNDRGMKLRGIMDANITLNTFLNNTDGVDAYDVDLYLEECSSNVLVDLNNFSKTGSTGIFAQAIDTLIITNNSFDMLSDTEKSARKVNDIYQYPAAIMVAEMFKQFIQGNRTSQPENITFVSSMKSNNITILTNTFDSDTQTFLVLQATSNVTTDISNFWYRKWNPITYLMDPIEQFISTSYSRLTWTNSIGSIKDLGYYGYGNTTGVPIYMAINFTNTWEYWQNINLTGSITIDRYNLTRALIYNTNGTLISPGNIPTNTGLLNITLLPGNSSYVLDDFNLTEGVARLYSPIWISFSNATARNISSNLTDAINTTTVFTGITCSDLQNISYLSHSGAFQKNFSSSENAGDYFCSGTTLLINLTNLEPAAGSNTLLFTMKAAAPTPTPTPPPSGGGGGTGTPVNSPITLANLTIIYEPVWYEGGQHTISAAAKNLTGGPVELSSINFTLIGPVNYTHGSVERTGEGVYRMSFNIINGTGDIEIQVSAIQYQKTIIETAHITIEPQSSAINLKSLQGMIENTAKSIGQFIQSHWDIITLIAIALAIVGIIIVIIYSVAGK